jgi:hypothetical protein
MVEGEVTAVLEKLKSPNWKAGSGGRVLVLRKY